MAQWVITHASQILHHMDFVRKHGLDLAQMADLWGHYFDLDLRAFGDELCIFHPRIL